MKCLIDESNSENISCEDDDEDFTTVTSAAIENDTTTEPTNQINLQLQKNLIK